MLMKTLKMHGHTCEEAENGQMAVQMVKEKDLTTYDAILMDFVMVIPPLSSVPSLPLTHTHTHAHTPLPTPLFCSHSQQQYNMSYVLDHFTACNGRS